MISKREVSDVRVSLCVEVDTSDPLNQCLVVAFRATVDGKEVYARTKTFQRPHESGCAYDAVERVVAGLIAKALSGEGVLEPNANLKTPFSSDDELTDMVHPCYKGA